MKVLRGMFWDDDGLPKVGSAGSKLGARPNYSEDDIHPEDRIKPGDTIKRDIPVSADGLVKPGTSGMSAFSYPVDNIPPHRRPPKHADGDDPRYEVYELETGDLPTELRCRIDPYNRKRQIFIEPAWEMSFKEYQQTLHSTRSLWHPV